MSEQPDESKTRQQRREEKQRRKRERMPKHGKGLVKAYINAVVKRVRGK